ncbi:transporter substrate-binding domain-containing protein [Butyrivibrio sp.]|uniref:transporter substrate-binding domain-containing protein n=1 Tax=Butyrivibrio sp. TaxID=28121 RepID=UPI0025B8F442|nr:transporter substrate-binding domain-containing protein [Butyrivibrio sp.]MBE5837700.1 transporter substrate-binding domain-containing protein [Butyrivibrio sp.]
MKKKFVSVLMALTTAMMFTACGQSATTENAESATESVSAESDLEYIKGKGNLIVGITDFAPMDYKDDNGEWIGFDADMAKEIAKALGVEAEFVEIDWDNKVLELNNKSIDVVWNGMTLTPEVTNSMTCTNAYCNNAQVVIVKAEDADKYSTLESLADLTFAVESGSAGEAAAIENNFNTTALKSQADAVMEVAAGTSDACIIDLLMAGAMVGEGTGYADLIHTVELTTEEYGIGCRKDSDLAAFINDEMKSLYANGTMKEIATKYGVQDALVEQ